MTTLADAFEDGYQLGLSETQQAATTLADGQLLMNGEVVAWPPRDINGQAIHLGDIVDGRSTMNLRDRHTFTVGGLRLQERDARLGWVVCAYDDADRYFEAWAGECSIVAGLCRIRQT